MTRRVCARYSLFAWTTILVCATVTSRAVGADDEPEVLLQDDFATYNPALGTLSDTQFVKDNVLHIGVEVGAWNRKFYQSTRLGDADATLRVRLPDFSGKLGHQVGLAFWAADPNDFYSLTVTDDGKCGVDHYRQGWYVPVVYRPSDLVKTAPGDWNELRVVTQGPVATTYVNGKPFMTLRGRPPKNGGMIGMFSFTGSKPLQTQFSSLKVVRPTGKPATKVVAPADDVVYAADPAFQDPGWGLIVDTFDFKDGRPRVKPGVNSLSWKLYLGDGDPNMSISAKARVNDGDDASTAGAGLAFWGRNKDEHYIFVVNEAGKFQVHHDANGKWDQPVPLQNLPASVKLNLKDWTELKVVAMADNATMMVNGVTVARIQGKAPSTCKFGLAATAGKTPSVAEFDAVSVMRLKPSEAPGK